MSVSFNGPSSGLGENIVRKSFLIVVLCVFFFLFRLLKLVWSALGQRLVKHDATHRPRLSALSYKCADSFEQESGSI